jgi:very-short-patch-repair endonuclease
VRDREATETIRVLAERQHGIVSRRQLLEFGVGLGAIQRRREGGVLVSVFPGVFALGHRRIDRKGRWMAAALVCGPGAVISHGSAAQLWGLRGTRGPIEVTRRSGGTRHPGIRLHQTRALEPAEVAEEAGIPVTSIERTLLDMAARLDDRQLERALVAADRSGRLSWPALARVLERRRGRRGAGRLFRIAGEVDPVSVEARSGPEVDFLALCRRELLPTPAVNVLVAGHLVDFLWAGERVVVEVDSYAYHGDRSAFERDHETDLDLVAAGYDVHHITDRMLGRDPRPFVANVRRALQARRPRQTASRS